MNKVLMVVIALLLLAVNWLTFHDLSETHSIRDWLILIASVLVFFHFARSYSKR